MEDQVVEVPRYRLEALVSCIESCVSLWKDGKDFSPGQRPDEILLHAAASIKGWIQNNYGNVSQSKE